MNLLASALGALIVRVDSFIRKDLFSVFLPGFVLGAELWIVFGRPSPYPGFFDHFLLAAAVIVYLSYMIGFCARQFSFYVAEAIASKSIRPGHTATGQDADAPQKRSRWDENLPYKTRRWGEDFYSRKAFHHNYRVLRQTFGEEHVNHALSKHPILLCLQEAEPKKADFHEVFHYCKTWLRVNAPELSTESMEIEFNLQLSIVPPVVLIPFTLLFLTKHWLLVLVSAGFALLCVIVMYRRGNHLRHAEAFNVLRNLAIAQWCFDTRLEDRSVTQTQAPDGRPVLPTGIHEHVERAL